MGDSTIVNRPMWDHISTDLKLLCPSLPLSLICRCPDSTNYVLTSPDACVGYRAEKHMQVEASFSRTKFGSAPTIHDVMVENLNRSSRVFLHAAKKKSHSH